MLFGFGHNHERRHINIVVEKSVNFHSTLGPSEFSPREQVEAKRDGAGIKGKQFMVESELVFAFAEPVLIHEMIEKSKIKVAVSLGGPVLVGVGKRGFVWGLGDAKVHKLAESAPETIADFPKRIRFNQMTIHHRHQLSPTCKSLGMLFAFMFFDQRVKYMAGHLLKHLTEKTCCSYHYLSPPLGFGFINYY